MDVSIIIVSFNTKKLTVSCVRSVITYTKGVTYEIIVVDNNSTDGSVEALSKLKSKTKIIKNKENKGFGSANNEGIKKAKGRYILLLNSDTHVSSNVVGEMVRWMDGKEEIGVSSCKLLNKDGSIQGTGGYFPTLIRVFSWMTIQDIPFVDRFIDPFHPMKEKSRQKANHFYDVPQELDWITGAFMLVRKDVFDEVGLFDEDYFMYTEEVDLCYRIKKNGWKVYYDPQWSIVHWGGASSTSEFAVLHEYEGIKLFYKKHYASWKYPILRLFLKIGAALRMVAFGFLEGRQSAQTYAKAFTKA